MGLFAAQSQGGEPRRATLITALIIGLGLSSGSLNAIAPLLTVFFLITCASINIVLLVEQSLGLISFRPTFRVPRAVPLVGGTASILAILAVSPVIGLVALSFVVLVYAWLLTRMLEAPFETLRSRLFVSIAGWAAKHVAALPPSSERSWKPDLLVLVRTAPELAGSYRLLRALTSPQGSIKAVGLLAGADAAAAVALTAIAHDFENDGIYATATALEASDFGAASVAALAIMAGAFFPPNIVYVNLREHPDAALEQILAAARGHEVGLGVFAAHPHAGLGRERTINVWVRDQSPDWQPRLKMASLDLALLLGLQLQQNWPIGDQGAQPARAR